MLIDQSYSFFNPKFGLSLTHSPVSMFYGSYSRANREPSRSDYESNINIKPEQLNDFELGWRFRKNGLRLNLNAYYMLYNEQLVLTGELDDVGTPIRTNSGSSYRMGIETEASVKLSEEFLINTNLTLSSNKNEQVLSKFDGKIFDFGKTNLVMRLGLKPTDFRKRLNYHSGLNAIICLFLPGGKVAPISC